MLKYLLNISIFLLCVSAKAQTNAVVLDSIKDLNGLKIEFDWAYLTRTGEFQKLVNSGLINNNGNTISKISLSGSDNFIEFKNDSIIGHLSYYGVRQLPGGYGNRDGGVNFNGVPKSIEFKKTKKRYKKIKFKIKDENNSTESYQVWVSLKSKNYVSVSLNSSHRSSIYYSGSIVEQKD